MTALYELKLTEGATGSLGSVSLPDDPAVAELAQLAARAAVLAGQ